MCLGDTGYRTEGLNEPPHSFLNSNRLHDVDTHTLAKASVSLRIGSSAATAVYHSDRRDRRWNLRTLPLPSRRFSIAAISQARRVPSLAQPRCRVAVSEVSFCYFAFTVMAAAVALDPRFEFTFEAGAPTAANLNAAGGNPFCTVGAAHFLHVASGGTLLPSPVAQGRFRVPWADVWVALLKVCTLDPAIQGTLINSRICSTRAMHDLFSRSADGGLSFAPLGSLSAAMALFVRTS